jgi:hypothetical protein
MTDTERELLKASIDKVVELETVQGKHHVAQILIVFDEGETPDVFFVEVEPGPDGLYMPKGQNGVSLLLSEIAAVRPYKP